MRPSLYLLIIWISLGACFRSEAILFWNLDNSANQTDPGTGAPWGSVPKVVNSTGSLLSGSAIYLGDGYLLTANHVTMDATYGFVTFNGTDFFQIDSTFKDTNRTMGKQVAANLDMAVFKLTTMPGGITPVSLLSTGSEQFNTEATLVGWGVGRNPADPLQSSTVNWGDSTTSAKRWGVNAPKTTSSIAYGSGSYTALVTVAGGTGAGFNPDGLGDSEAAATLYDSGAGLFQNISGTWNLIGLSTAVEHANITTFGDDKISSPHGDFNYLVRISDYDDQILALIPEPSTITLTFTGLFLTYMAARRLRTIRSIE